MFTIAYAHRPQPSTKTPTTTTTAPLAHALQSSKHRPPNKASYLVPHPPRKRIKSILADNISSPPPFERASSKGSPFYSHAGSSTEALTSSSSLKAKLSSKLKRKSIPQRSPSPIQTDYSSPDTSSKSLFTPAKVYPIASSRSTTSFLVQKSASSPLLFDPLQASPPPYSKHPTPVPVPVQPSPHMNSDTDDDRDDNDMIYTSRLGSSARPASSSSQSLRSRIFGLASTSTSTNASRVRDKPICTTPGMLCAGETETETDEPSRHLPTARIIPSSRLHVLPNSFEERLTPFLFEFSRLLSIVPAIFGTLYNLYHILYPPTYDRTSNNVRPPPERVDYFISALWAILTGYQCLSLATGLLTRWRVYYPPLSTLVRLLALQGICWPATHLTLSILEHEKRPVICWAVIATTTCMSRSVQIWVTSNLWWEKRGSIAGPGTSTTHDGSLKDNVPPPHTLHQHQQQHHYPPPPPHAGASTNGGGGGGGIPLGSANSIMASGSGTGTGVSPMSMSTSMPLRKETRHPYWKRWGGGGKWGGRRWDWQEVGIKCVLPAGIVYFIMAWAEVLRREFALAAVGVVPGAGAAGVAMGVP